MHSQFIRRFLQDDKGSVSVMMMPWLMLFLAISGIATDFTRAFQVDTMLQGTADAAALAASIDLPNEAAALASALEYVEKNMPYAEYGEVLQSADIEFGKWDADNHIFKRGETPADAIRVRVQQAQSTGNAVTANLLRIIGLQGWNLERYAIAQRFTPTCLDDGLIARGHVDTSSNNEYFNFFCVHGQEGVFLQNGNTFHPTSSVSMPDFDLLQLPTGGMTSNPGLPEALKEARLDPRDVDLVSEIIDGFINKTYEKIPSYIDKSKPVLTVDWKYDFKNAVPGRIYHVVCPANKNIGIPGQTILREVVVVAECQIGVQAGASLRDVILASRAPASNSGANIHFSSSVNLGKPDSCSPGGGVVILTTESLFFSSSVTYNGVQIVSAKDVSLGSSDEGVKGLSVQAGGNIYLSSNNRFGLCGGGELTLVSNRFFRLVF